MSRDLWTIIEELKNRKHMVRMALFPGGNLNLAVYDSEKQMMQYMYDHYSFEELEAAVKKDWGHLIISARPLETPKTLPRPAGFPKP